MSLRASDRAKAARTELELALLDCLAERPEDAINNEIARDTSMESDFSGQQKNYLSLFDLWRG